MLPKTKKYLITTEKYEVIAIQQKPQSFRKYCPECQKEVEMLRLDEITSQTGKRTRELFRLIENHSLHSIETESGHLLICRNSLETTDEKKLIN